MIKALFESFWLFYVFGGLLWGYLGLLAASRQRLPLILGVVVGAFFWFFGVLGLLIVGASKNKATAKGWIGSGHSVLGRPSAAAQLPAASGHSAWGQAPAGAAPGGYAGYAAAPASSAAATAGSSRALFPVILGCAAAAGFVIAMLLPWGQGRVAWSQDSHHVSGSVKPYQVGIVAVIIIVSAGVVGLAAMLDRSYGRGSWLALAALVSTFWLTLLVEWIILNDGVRNASDRITGSTGKVADASFDTASGAWVMLASCAAVYAWLAWRTVALVRRRQGRTPVRTATPAPFAPSTQNPASPW